MIILWAERPEIPRNKALPSIFGNAFFGPGAEGIEPPPKVLETPIIPLDQAPLAL